MRFTRAIQSIHLAIVCLVLFQLFSEQVMEIPKPDKAIDDTQALFLLLHEWNGFIVLGLTILFLLIRSDKGQERHSLFPWLSVSGWKGIFREIFHDVPGWFRGKLKKPEESFHIASTVHGLGILLLLGLGATGIMVFIGLQPDGFMDKDTKAIKDLHSGMGNLIWIFVLGHSAMALLHQLAGHRVFQSMFLSKAGVDEDASNRDEKKQP
ncbi:MAG TPA: cytochrome b/b6 domain-containing protein [Mariprofundaceae bacterium]|nr:cytochrome b/b6 domain-containing protein [Mariprofundaceae bacterium]